MMKKWVNVKDSWLRYNKRIWDQKNSSTTGRKIKKYIFNDELQFLEKNYIHNETLNDKQMFEEFRNESNSTADIGGTVSEGDIDHTFDDSLSDNNGVEDKFQNYDMHPCCKKLKVSNDRLSMNDSGEDRHMSFFRGILPSLRTLSENEVFEFQVGLMQTLKGIKDAQKGNNVTKP